MAQGVPSSIGPYTILGELGRGGMGVVYHARREDIGREVALKVIRPGNDADPESMARFTREARAAAKLAGHPGIVGVLDAGEEDGRAFFAMEYVAARPLDEAIDAGELTWRRSAELLAKVARAVDYAHVNGILHRDLKPSNILIDERGEPWVTDFGLARSQEAEADSVKLTKSGYIVGTPAYLSPEQARGQSHDARADIWSLGVTLYECLTALMPFQADSTFEVINLVQRQDPRPVRSVAPEIPVDLETICMKCLEKVADRRYPTAGALAADLEAFLEGRPIAARPPSLAYRASRWAGRNRKSLMTAAAATVLLAGAGALLYAVVIAPRWRAEEQARAKSDADAAAAKAAEAKKAKELEKELAAARAREAALPHLEDGREALMRLERVLAGDDWTPRERIELAEEARAHLELALAACPGHAEALLEFARSWRLVNGAKEAIAACDRALQAHPRFTPARLERAILMLEDVASNSDDVAQAPNAVSAETRARFDERIRADLEVLREHTTDAGERAVAEGMLAMVDRRHAAAAAKLQAVAEQRVSDPRAWKWAGWAWNRLQEDAKAEAAFDRALRYRPLDIVALRGRALAREVQGNVAGARADYDLVLKRRPTDWGTYSNRGGLRRQMGDYAGSEADLTKALQLNPRSGLARVQRGITRYKVGNMVGAKRDLQEAVEILPRNGFAHHHLGYVLTMTGDEAGGLAAFNRALELDPDDAESLAYRGTLLHRAGRSREAIRDLDKAVALQPRNPLSRVQRARTLGAVNRIDDALKDLDVALDVSPHYPEALYDRGRLRMLNKQLKAGIADLEAALACAPPNWPYESFTKRLITAAKLELQRRK